MGCLWPTVMLAHTACNGVAPGVHGPAVIALSPCLRNLHLLYLMSVHLNPASALPNAPGYDAHYQDPLEKLQLQAGSYHWLAAAVRRLAEELCGGRLLLLLEGG